MREVPRIFAIGLLKKALWLTTRRPTNLMLAKLVSEEYQLFYADQVLRTHRPALLGRMGDCVRKGRLRECGTPTSVRAGSVLLPKLLGTYELELQRGRERCEPARPEHGGTRGDLARAARPAMGWPI